MCHSVFRFDLQKERHLVFDSLFDTCLALTSPDTVISNTLKTDNKNTFIITGANQEWKINVPAQHWPGSDNDADGNVCVCGVSGSDICRQIFTHYKCEEDSHMVSGKLDEELRRMRDIVSELKPDDLVLFNESFAATNSREGAGIIRG
jgi:DNA mismatch repair ATPase MutS